MTTFNHFSLSYNKADEKIIITHDVNDINLVPSPASLLVVVVPQQDVSDPLAD